METEAAKTTGNGSGAATQRPAEPTARPAEPEILEGHVIAEDQSALVSLSRAEIDVQISTAKRYPRSIVAFQRQAMEMATLDEETAASMFYALPRSGRTIEGPSVRLAEIVGSAWGNLHYGARALDPGPNDRFIVAQGIAWDLEKNVRIQYEVRRRITDKNAKRYNDDMIGVTGNAAASIALRNAIFKVVPFAYVKRIYEEAKLVSIGKALTMEQRRSRALEWFSKLGVKEAQILVLLGKKGLEDVDVDDLVTLNGLKTAIKEGDTTIEEVFRDAQVQKPPMPPEGTPADPLVAAAAGKTATPAPAGTTSAAAPAPVAPTASGEPPSPMPVAAPRPNCVHVGAGEILKRKGNAGKVIVCEDCTLNVRLDAFGKVVLSDNQ